MINGLQFRKEMLLSMRSQNNTERNLNITNLKTKTEIMLARIQKVIENGDDQILASTGKMMFNWLKNKKNFFILPTLEQPNNFEFMLIKEDFSLLADITFACNGNPSPMLFKYPMLHELLYIVSAEQGQHVGTAFITDFIKLSTEDNTPIMLYCSKEIVSYYEKFDFISLYSEGKNGEEEWCMAYIPNQLK